MCRLRPKSRSCITQSGVGDPKGNGFVEQEVQSIAGKLRVHQLSLEKMISQKVPCGHLVMGWLVEHCADVLNRHQVEIDGRTPYQRLKGRRLVGNMLEFGSMVMFRASGKAQDGSMQERWCAGVWLGKKLHTDEHIVMRNDG